MIEKNITAGELTHVIEPQTGVRFINWRELFEYRDLFMFLIWRQIKVRYAQSAIGIGWAIIQPLFAMIVFTIVFGNLAKIDSEGAPYALFSLAALLPWTFFSNALTDGVASLVSEADMIRKVYFPRLLLPLSAVTAKLLDFAIASCMMAVLMIYFRHAPTLAILVLPLLIALMVLSAAAVSTWLTALAVQYRDVKHAMTFVVQTAMYATPVVYSASIIPEQYRLWYAINPMVGVIEGFRSGLLGTQQIPWDLIAVSAVSSLTIFSTGIIFFRSKEKIFADVA